jgi:hypothetical protein
MSDPTLPRLPREDRFQRPDLAYDATAAHQTVLYAVAVVLLGTAAAAFYNPSLMLPVFVLGVGACIGAATLRWPVIVSAAWLMVAATTPEMWLADVYPGDENAITAAVKMLGLALVAVCVLRYGMRFDAFNPGYAFGFMYFTGFLHGLHPQLTAMDSTRSLIGSAAPFAFSFSRLSRRWCQAIIRTTIWAPSFIVAFGAVLAAAGVRPLWNDLDGVLRLSGSTHPAFLAGFAMTGVFAGLVELYREGRNRDLVLMVVNFVILVASGGRAPLFCAVTVAGLSFLFLRSEAYRHTRRVLPLLLGVLVLPVMLAMASGSSEIRILNVLSSEAGDLSGRDVIWPYFEDAWSASPLLGWGVGAGKVVVDPDSLTAKLLGTTAAHNEYLRIGVDGGDLGLGVLIALMALWVVHNTWRARGTDRFILRLVFVAFAIQSVTDNTLIAATASVLFTWVSAVFARAHLEGRAPAPDVLQDADETEPELAAG